MNQHTYCPSCKARSDQAHYSYCQSVRARMLPREEAPKDGTPFLAWVPIEDNDGEWRVVWWEGRGQFTSDRDLGDEPFTCWTPLPPQPAGAPL